MRVTGWSEATGPAGGFQAARHSSARSGNARQAGGFHPSPVMGPKPLQPAALTHGRGLPEHLQLFSLRSHPRGRGSRRVPGVSVLAPRAGCLERAVVDTEHCTAPHGCGVPRPWDSRVVAWRGEERRGEGVVVVVMRRRRGGGREAVGVFWGIYNRPFQVQICIAYLNLNSEEKALMKLADDFDAN